MQDYNILVIEDDRDDYELIKLELTKIKPVSSVQIAGTEEELHAIFKAKKLHLVISDHNVSSFTGKKALEIVKKYDENLPFIICSGYMEAEETAEAIKQGVSGVVLKNHLVGLGQFVRKELEGQKSKERSKSDDELINAAFDSSGIGKAIINEKGLIVKSNQDFAGLTGYSISELRGKPWTELINEKYLKNAREVIHSVLTEGRVKTAYWEIMHDGKPQYVRWTICRMNNYSDKKYILCYLHHEWDVLTDFGLKKFDTAIMYKRIRLLIEHNKLYRKPDLKVKDIANILRTNNKYISTTINKMAGVSFNRFINEYRIKDAIKKLTDPACQGLPIKVIIEQVGFGNEISFYRNFKAITSITPSQYKPNISHSYE
ncbi:MAG: helix-turn-helix domain-containing protein [Balneolales bacterium]